MKTVKQWVKVGLKKVGKVAFMVAFAFVLVAAQTQTASAQTDITTAITTLSGYWDAIIVVALAVVLFVVGRRLLRKM